MIRKHSKNVEKVENRESGFEGMSARYLWTREDGCQNFAMRLMAFEPEGKTSYHSHFEDHEFFILEGEAGYVDAFKKEIRLKPGDTVYVPPEEPHQIKNAGSGTLRLL